LETVTFNQNVVQSQLTFTLFYTLHFMYFNTGLSVSFTINDDDDNDDDKRQSI